MARNMAFPVDQSLPIDGVAAPSRPRLVQAERGGRAIWVLVVSAALVCGVFFYCGLSSRGASETTNEAGLSYQNSCDGTR